MPCPLLINGASTLVALALRGTSTAPAIYAQVAAQMLTRPDPQHTAAGLLLMPMAQVMPTLAQVLQARASGRALLDAALVWGQTARRLHGPSLPGWDVAMSSLFEAALASEAGAIGIEQVDTWCQGLKALAIANPVKLLGAVLARVVPLSDPSAFPALLAHARTVVPNFYLPWLANLYTPAIVQALFDLEQESAVTRALGQGNGNRFDTGLREVWRQGTQVAKRMGIAFPFAAPTLDAVRKVATGRDLAWFRQALQEWQRRYDDLVQTHALQDLISNTRLAHARQARLDWHEALERFMEASGASFEHVFVVDTNALIDCPDLPKRLRSNQLLVLPATVIDELDKKKTEPQLRERCTNAVRHLRALAPTQIRFEIADVSLLPDDYRKTADNRILAVARKYANNNLRLVTGDQNLSLKAQAMNIIAVGVERFMDRPVMQRGTAPSAKLNRDKPANFGKRTGT